MNENGVKNNKLFIFSFFVILFCFCGFIFGICLNYSPSLHSRLKSLMKFESSVKLSIKDRLQSKVVSSGLVRFLKSKMVDLTSKSLVRGVYKKGDTLLNIPVLPEKSQIVECCAEIEKFCNRTNSVPFVLLLSTKFQLNGGFSEAGYFNSYEKDLINFFKSKLNDRIINLQSNFFSAYFENVDFFYRTASLMNSFGSFLAYSSIAKQLNIQPLGFNNFRIRTCCDNFYGNLFSENFIDLVKPDSVDLFELESSLFEKLVKANLKVRQFNLKTAKFDERNSIFDLEMLASTEKNKVLFGGNSPVKVVETNFQDAENVLIFSDGNVDGLMQFLALHFKKVVVVDLNQLKKAEGSSYYALNRFFKKEVKKFEKVLFIYGIESLANSRLFKQLARFRSIK